MNPEIQRRMIAGASGYTNVHYSVGGLVGLQGDIAYYTPVPRYVDSLDAIHGAMMEQPREVRDRANAILIDMMGDPMAAIDAPPHARAKALLWALEMWEEPTTAKDGLLWRDGKIVPLQEADREARKHGFLYAEQLVEKLEQRERDEIPPDDGTKDYE